MVATEIGIAYALGKPIIGFYSDTRQGFTANDSKLHALKTTVAENQFHYINLFTVGCIKKNGSIAHNIDRLIENIKEYL